MTKIDFTKFEKKSGLSFVDKNLLKMAFTHRSYLNENRGETKEHNERLEFLGDAVLELIVTGFLFERFPSKTEGDLTAYRAAMVNAVTLSKVASGIGMNDFLLLSRGEGKDTGRARQIILANTIEALIGAIYLDKGFDEAKKFVAEHLFNMVDDIIKNESWMDHKSKFQEKAQDEEGITPSYKTLKEIGPDHDKKFNVGVYLGNELVATGEGKSKQEAEQEAAKNGLDKKGW